MTSENLKTAHSQKKKKGTLMELNFKQYDYKNMPAYWQSL